MRAFSLVTLVTTLSLGCADLTTVRPPVESIIEVSTRGHLSAGFEQTRTVELARAGECALKAPPSIADRPSGGRLPDAGVLRVTAQGLTIEATPDDHGDYHRRLPAAPLRAPDQPIAIDGSGGAVSAFHVEVTAPHPMTLEPDSALEPVDGAISVLRDLTFHWMGAQDSTVGVIIEAGRTHVECRFAGAAGMGVVPQRLLAELPLGAARRVVWSGHETRTRLGAHELVAAAVAVAVEGDVMLEAR